MDKIEFSRTALIEMLDAAPARQIELNGYSYSYCLVKRLDGIETAAIYRMPIGGKIFRDAEIVYYTPEVRI